MKSETINTTTLQTAHVKLEETSSKINLGQVFEERGGYLNELYLFLAHFNTIPNLISEENIDCKKANARACAELFQIHLKNNWNGSNKFIHAV